MQLNDLINYPKNIRYNASMRGNVVGHMTTIFSESINSMVKSIRYLVMSSLVEETSFKTAKLFVIRGQQLDNDQLRLAVFRSPLQGNEMNNGQQESNTHIVNEINRHNHAFIKTETQVSLQTSRPHGRFRVMLFTMCCRYFIEHFVYNNFFGLLSHELI